MKRLMLLLMLIPSLAQAFTTWTVTDVASLKQANVGAVAGDVINVAYLAGGYSWRPFPANSGDSTSQITYHGDLNNTSNPLTAVIFNSGYGPADSANTKSYVTWEGFYFRNGEIGFNSDSAIGVARPRGLKYIKCTSEGGSTIKFVRDCLIQNCVIGRNKNDRTLIVRGFTDSVRIKQTSMRLFQDVGGQVALRIDTQFDVNESTMDTMATPGRVWERHLEIDSCNIQVVTSGSTCDKDNPDDNPQCIKMRHWRGGSFSYNAVTTYDSSTGGCAGKPKTAVWIRDSVNGLTWTGTTFVAKTGAVWWINPTNDGNHLPVASFPANLAFNDCTFRNEGTSVVGNGFDWRGGANNLTMRRCSFVSGSGAGGTFFHNGSGFIDIQYCNFVNTGGKPAIEFSNNNFTEVTKFTFRNNIVYSRGALLTSDPALMFRPAAMNLAVNAVVSENRNDFWNSTDNTHCIVYGDGVVRNVGSSGYGCGTFNRECNSLRNSPGLTDSNVTTYNPALLAGSVCIDAGDGGTDIGASQVVDLTAPSAITDMQAYGTFADSTITIYFTAPGDDAGVGTVHHYLVRADSMTFSSFTAADTIHYSLLGGILKPAGQIQTLTIAPEDLHAFIGFPLCCVSQGYPNGIMDFVWWVRVYAVDNEGNVSAISNIANPVIVRGGQGGTRNPNDIPEFEP